MSPLRVIAFAAPNNGLQLGGVPLQHCQASVMALNRVRPRQHRDRTHCRALYELPTDWPLEEASTSISCSECRESILSRRDLLQGGAQAALLLGVSLGLSDLLLGSEGASASETIGVGPARAASPSAFPTSSKAIFEKAAKRALGGGASGASAAVVQVFSLMWLRTTMNYQYRYGKSTQEALQELYEEGGVPRFYQGLPFALVQGPLSRFGDTAANVGVLALLEGFEATRDLPLPLKSVAGSLAAALWRILLTPVDTFKTSMQVSGAAGIPTLLDKARTVGPSALFEGALAGAAATFVGHYPWFFTYNSLNALLPVVDDGTVPLKLARQALLGLCASSVSDCCSNSIRVVKTTKQTSSTPLTYADAVKLVVDEDGVTGLFLRGLQTRLLVNALQVRKARMA
ncbi:unnamed protein product [Discosporangium mesarthrocarpum]